MNYLLLQVYDTYSELMHFRSSRSFVDTFQRCCYSQDGRDPSYSLNYLHNNLQQLYFGASQ